MNISALVLNRGNVTGEFASNVHPPTDKFVGEEEQAEAEEAARREAETLGKKRRRFIDAVLKRAKR